MRERSAFFQCRVRLFRTLLAITAFAAGPSATIASPPPAAVYRIDLRQATADQTRRFAGVFATVQDWVRRGAFPGAVLAIGQHDRIVALKAFGRMSVSPGARAMPVNAIFDLASLTKVIATTTAAEILYDRGKLDLDAPVVRYIPEFAAVPGHRRITVRDLLAHCSGLSSDAILWKTARTRGDIMRAIYQMPMGWKPGTHYQYRDENMMLMGEIIARLSGMTLDAFVTRNVFAPLDMPDTGYNPPKTMLSRIPPTELDDVFRHRLVHGVVHDENAYVMGGVSGHAGLFSTARDLSHLAQMYLNGGTWDGRRVVRRSTIALFMKRQMLPPGSSRALGWDTGAPAVSFAGSLASPEAILHTGFTGTSIYIDPARDAFVILLSNRVNPTRRNDLIFPARTAIHAAALSVLDTGGR